MNVYLITGGAGFIGANFVKYMLKHNQDIILVILDKLTYAGNVITIQDDLNDSRVIFVEGDIRDQFLVEHLFQKYKIQYVVNFAAESHVDRSISNPQIFVETNVLGTQILLEAAKLAWNTGVDSEGYPLYRNDVKFLQVSTDEVYGTLSKEYEEPRELVISDEKLRKVTRDRGAIRVYGDTFFTEEMPLDPRSPYSASKASADLLVLAYYETFKLPINITRCSNNYGPYHFPEKLIPLVIQNVLYGKKLPVYGKGNNVRDWLFVEDHAKAIDVVLNRGKIGEVYNVGGFNENENINIIRLIIKTLVTVIQEEPQLDCSLKIDIAKVNDSLITYVQDRLGHDMRYSINPSKIVTDLGWYPETTFEVGIKKTVKWYLENQSWVEEVTKKN